MNVYAGYTNDTIAAAIAAMRNGRLQRADAARLAT